MPTFGAQLDGDPALNWVAVPDLWQQEAVADLRSGRDVVVQAPTGAGKTLIFELWSRQGKNRGQAIYTVPTRALANDKLSEWRALGWDVGIATGDLSENLEAPILVATLETQKNRLIHGDGPSLLVIDEYQMLGDAERGLNYELAIALAPPETQLLLLSGSVRNPNHVVRWLERLGRRAALVQYDERPVPLEEVCASSLKQPLPREIRSYWPRLVANALAEGLAPILIFAPRRKGAESLAHELARQLPNPDPLVLTREQANAAGPRLARLLHSRIAYHHSGLSYPARAGVLEPLAKAGQLRVVVATMGLAAGINFSLRSVTLAADSYRRNHQEQPLRPDEILQMFGRAGRRGIDEVGFVIISANDLRLRDGYPCHLTRNGMVDWGALLAIMHGAREQGRDPFEEAVRVQERLFTAKPIVLGVESSLEARAVPCGLQTDTERARHARKQVREFINSHGEWEPLRPLERRAIKEIKVRLEGPNPFTPGREAAPNQLAPSLPRRSARTEKGLVPMLTLPQALEAVGQGILSPVMEAAGEKIYGRVITVADRLRNGRMILAKWTRKLTRWRGRQVSAEDWENRLQPLIARKLAAQDQPVIRFVKCNHTVRAELSLGDLTRLVPVDRYGVGLWHPTERKVPLPECQSCEQFPICRRLSPATGTAMLWRRLKLVDSRGRPTQRGRIVSFFSQGDGLAIAAALEDATYPLDELIYDIANLDAGFRFSREESRLEGRLAGVCRGLYGPVQVAGYLENGVPPRYGSGADAVVHGIHKNTMAKHSWLSEWLGVGDIDRVIIQWRSLLRRIVHAPRLEWDRWEAFKRLAKDVLSETESPAVIELPGLLPSQTKRVDHRLKLHRHG